MPNALIILAAGQGSRMQSDLPKVLHEVAGAPLLFHAMDAGDQLEPHRIVVVTGHGAEAVAEAARSHVEGVEIARQDEQLGTAHAVARAETALSGFSGDVFVLYGDTPFIRPETLLRMADARRAGNDVVVLGFEATDPGRYGRLVAREGQLDRIVEYKDATPEERAITLCNSGVICADRDRLFQLVARVANENASGEYYLTDIVGLARAEGAECAVVLCPETETMGVNTRADLAAAEAAFQERARAAALELGVTMVAPETVFFAYDTHLGRDTLIEPHVVFGPGVTVETGARVRAFSHLEGCHLGCGAVVGPYARLRPGAELDENARVGNFVEIKNATLGVGAKVNHLSYVGDAEIGARANIGAGTITCNYDGVFKHRTVIGEEAFVGSNSALVAPVRLGARAMTGSGSVITGDVPDGALALGRGRQVNKPGLAEKLMNRLRDAKKSQKRQNGAD